jgi:hypothetical protein
VFPHCYREAVVEAVPGLRSDVAKGIRNAAVGLGLTDPCVAAGRTVRAECPKSALGALCVKLE